MTTTPEQAHSDDDGAYRPRTNLERYWIEPRRWRLQYRLCKASRALLEPAEYMADPPLPIDASTPIIPAPMPDDDSALALVIEALADGSAKTARQLAEATERSLSGVRFAASQLQAHGDLVRVQVPSTVRPDAGHPAWRLRNYGDG